MNISVRLGWLPGEAVVLPGQFPAASGGGSNSLIIGPLAQDASGSSLRVCCSARTAEVLLLENGGGTATYECTLRGIPAAGGDTSTNNLFVLEYTPQGGLRAGSTITFKLLSLIDKSSITIQSVDLLEKEHTLDTSNKNEAAAPAISTAAASAASSSQMDGIRDLLAQLAVQPEDSAGDNTADPKRALMAAIAKSALKKGNQMNNPIDSTSQQSSGGGSGGSSGSLNSKDIDAALALLPQMMSLLHQQQQEIRELKTSIDKIEALCLETQNLVVAGQLDSSTAAAEKDNTSACS